MTIEPMQTDREQQIQAAQELLALCTNELLGLDLKDYGTLRGQLVHQRVASLSGLAMAHMKMADMVDDDMSGPPILTEDEWEKVKDKKMVEEVGRHTYTTRVIEFVSQFDKGDRPPMYAVCFEHAENAMKATLTAEGDKVLVSSVENDDQFTCWCRKPADYVFRSLRRDRDAG